VPIGLTPPQLQLIYGLCVDAEEHCAVRVIEARETNDARSLAYALQLRERYEDIRAAIAESLEAGQITIQDRMGDMHRLAHSMRDKDSLVEEEKATLAESAGEIEGHISSMRSKNRSLVAD
jgi:hypothetical protein